MRKLEPHITVRAVQPVIAALEALGHQVDSILDEAKISRAMLQDADGRVPHSAMMLFWECALTVTGDDHLGVHLAEAVPIQSFEVHSYALLSSSTLQCCRSRFPTWLRRAQLVFASVQALDREGAG